MESLKDRLAIFAAFQFISFVGLFRPERALEMAEDALIGTYEAPQDIVTNYLARENAEKLANDGK